MPVERIYHLYAIASLRRNYIYVGITENVIERFHRHNQGFERTTTPYLPYLLIYSELFGSRTEARVREVYFKNASGKRFLKKIRISLFTASEVAGLPA